MVVWIMLAYSCWQRARTHERARAHTPTQARDVSRRVRRTRIRSVHVRGRRRRAPTSVVYAGGSDVGAFVARQPGLAQAACITTPSIHQFIIHLMTTRERVRASGRELFPTRVRARVPLARARGRICFHRSEADHEVKHAGTRMGSDLMSSNSDSVEGIFLERVEGEGEECESMVFGSRASRSCLV